jgi:hypothetical protein
MQQIVTNVVENSMSRQNVTLGVVNGRNADISNPIFTHPSRSYAHYPQGYPQIGGGYGEIDSHTD